MPETTQAIHWSNQAISPYLPNTALTLDAKESQTYTFRFSSVEDEADMRSTLYQNDIIDMVAVPGFAYSGNMPGKIYLHTEVPQEDIQVSGADGHQF